MKCDERRNSERTVLYGVTVGTSAFSFLRGQLAWLREQGWDVHLAACPDDLATRAAEREGVRFHPVVMHRNISLLADAKSLVEWVRLLSELRPAVVNIGTPKAGLLGTLSAMICRVPRRIYVLHGLRLEGAKGVSAAFLWLMEWLTIRCATDVVVVSKSLGREARRRRLLPAGGCWLVGEGSCNGVPSDVVAESVASVNREELRNELGFADDEFVIGYVGRLTRDKGLKTLEQAIGRIPSSKVRLLLIGPVEDGSSQECLDVLGGRAVHLGWTDDVWQYYAAMDSFCLPTRREGFGNVVLEAAAAGLPTITTNATGAIDSVIDNVTGRIVPVDDDVALAGAIVDLEGDPNLVHELGVAAKHRARRDFDPKQIWEGIESILSGAPLRHVRRI